MLAIVIVFYIMSLLLIYLLTGHLYLLTTFLQLLLPTPHSIQSPKTRPGADFGSDHELLIAKFRLKLKKVGKTTRPFRYALNQIP